MPEIVVKEHVEDRNEVKFTGVMIGKSEYSSLMMVYFRSTTRHGARTYTNNPNFAVFDPEVRKKINNIPLRSKVEIKAYITSSKQKKDENGAVIQNRYPEQSFVLTDINPVSADTPDSNVIDIVGTVDRAYVTQKGIVNFSIVSFREKKYMKRIRVVAFPKDNINYLTYMAGGSRVHITAHCSTTSHDTEEGMKYFEYIVLDSIEKA